MIQFCVLLERFQTYWISDNSVNWFLWRCSWTFSVPHFATSLSHCFCKWSCLPSKLARVTVASPEAPNRYRRGNWRVSGKAKVLAVSRQHWLQTRQFQLPFEIINRLLSFPVSHVASEIGFRVIQELQGFFCITRRECCTHNLNAFALWEKFSLDTRSEVLREEKQRWQN